MALSLSSVRAHRATCAPRTATPSLGRYVKVWKQRRDLSRLDHTRLKDLGISVDDAAREAARPFWDLP